MKPTDPARLRGHMHPRYHVRTGASRRWWFVLLVLPLLVAGAAVVLTGGTP